MIATRLNLIGSRSRKRHSAFQTDSRWVPYKAFLIGEFYHVFLFTENERLVKSRDCMYNIYLPKKPDGKGKARVERKPSLEYNSVEPQTGPPQRRGCVVAAMAVAVTIILLFALFPPVTLLDKADLIGYGICHRIPDRSFLIGDRQSPLCARCTGTFLGAIVGLAAMLLLGRRRASRLPPIPVLGVLVLFVGFWGFDGLNSYLTFFPNAIHLYEPRNWLRLTTGLLNGLALVTFVFPIFNFTIWQETTRKQVFESLWEIAALLPVMALLILALLSGVEFLLYPLAVLSSAGVMMMLILINSLIAAVALRREGMARTWKEALVPLTVGAALAIVEISAMVAVRAYLTMEMGMPF